MGALRSAWLFESEEHKTALKKFQLSLCADKAHEIGWDFKESDGHIEQQFKALLFGSAGLCGDEKIKAASFEMLKKFAGGDRSAIHPNIRGSVYAICLTYGGAEEFEIILKEYRSAENVDERNSALRSLGRARDPALIKRVLEMPLSPDVKGQDLYIPIAGMGAHRDGVEALWEWTQANWGELMTRLPPGLSMLGAVVGICTRGFTRDAHADKIKAFYGERSTKGFDQSLAQSLDTIAAKDQWIRRDSADVEQWLQEHGFLSK